jgi:hypothetical protein
MTSKTQGPWIRLLGSAFALALAVAACSHANAAPGATARVHLENFKIGVAPTLPAGLTTLAISSSGPTMHELNVVRTERAANALPLAADGTVDDLSPHPDFDHLAEAEGIDIGDHASLTVNLTPGHYVLYCNMEGHYMAGMRASFTVH